MTQVESKIATLNQEKQQSITEANQALQAIPNATLIDPKKLDEVLAKVEAAKVAVQKAKEKSAVDTDFIGFSKIQAAENKVK